MTTAIGEQGKRYTEYAISAVLTRTGQRTWSLEGTLDGASDRNFEFRRTLSVRELTTSKDSVRDAKAQAMARLAKAAAGFLKIPVERLAPMNNTWIDDSD